jgi:hypothetical protein
MDAIKRRANNRIDIECRTSDLDHHPSFSSSSIIARLAIRSVQLDLLYPHHACLVKTHADGAVSLKRRQRPLGMSAMSLRSVRMNRSSAQSTLERLFSIDRSIDAAAMRPNLSGMEAPQSRSNIGILYAHLDEDL